jgi:hypothetical protein
MKKGIFYIPILLETSPTKKQCITQKYMMYSFLLKIQERIKWTSKSDLANHFYPTSHEKSGKIKEKSVEKYFTLCWYNENTNDWVGLSHK